MIDISAEDFVRVDGKVVTLSLIRAVMGPDLGRVRGEYDDGSVEELEIRREGQAVHFIRSPRSAKGTDQKPVQTEFRAELLSPDKRERQWVTRGDADDSRLRQLGWKEEGVTRKRTPPPPEEPDPLADPPGRRP